MRFFITALVFICLFPISSFSQNKLIDFENWIYYEGKDPFFHYELPNFAEKEMENLQHKEFKTWGKKGNEKRYEYLFQSIYFTDSINFNVDDTIIAIVMILFKNQNSLIVFETSSLNNETEIKITSGQVKSLNSREIIEFRLYSGKGMFFMFQIKSSNGKVKGKDAVRFLNSVYFSKSQVPYGHRWPD